MLGFTNRGGMQTSISVPVKGFFSKFGCDLHWGVVQLGQDHGAPPAPCMGAQGCTGVHGCTFSTTFLFRWRAEIWYECLNFDFINFFIHHILKKKLCSGAQWCRGVHRGAQGCTGCTGVHRVHRVHRGAQGAQSAHFPNFFVC